MFIVTFTTLNDFGDRFLFRDKGAALRSARYWRSLGWSVLFRPIPSRLSSGYVPFPGVGVRWGRRMRRLHAWYLRVHAPQNDTTYRATAPLPIRASARALF